MECRSAHVPSETCSQHFIQSTGTLHPQTLKQGLMTTNNLLNSL